MRPAQSPTRTDDGEAQLIMLSAMSTTVRCLLMWGRLRGALCQTPMPLQLSVR
jgi:hypothetical protein